LGGIVKDEFAGFTDGGREDVLVLDGDGKGHDFRGVGLVQLDNGMTGGMWYVCFVDDLVCEEVVGLDDLEVGRLLDRVIQEFRIVRVHYKTSILASI
jgi:hypothetical protein